MNNQLRIHAVLSVGSSCVENALKNIDILIENNIDCHVVWREGCKPRHNLGAISNQIEIEHASLSHARNVLLKVLDNQYPSVENDIVCFIDDDGSIPSNFGEEIRRVFGDSKIVWALGNYHPLNVPLNEKRFPKIEIYRCTRKQILSISSSLGIYVRFKTLKSVGFFDENLGVGARIGVGEDTDLAIRLFNATKSSHYFPQLTQFHPYKQGKYSALIRLRFLAYLARRDSRMIFSFLRYGVRVLLYMTLTIFKLILNFFKLGSTK